MSRDDFDKLLDRYLKNRCSPDEEKIISQWYNSLTEAQSGIPERALDDMESKLWSQIERKINEPETAERKLEPRKSTNRYLGPLGIAAALMLLTVVAIYQFYKTEEPSNLATIESQPVEEVTGVTVIRNNDSRVVKPVRLADGSLIVLQPQGEVSFNKAFSSGIREVSLTGEAFFEIARDPQRPFVVHAEGLVTRVLGTSFNIKAKPGDRKIVVDVKSGKVAVYKENKNDSEPEYHLTPNQQAVYDRDSDMIVQQLQEDPQVIITEEEMSEMRFDDEKVSVVFEAIEKTYGVELEYDEETFERCTLTTRMTNEGMNAKLEIITKALGATYEVQGTKVLVAGKGCK